DPAGPAHAPGRARRSPRAHRGPAGRHQLPQGTKPQVSPCGTECRPPPPHGGGLDRTSPVCGLARRAVRARRATRTPLLPALPPAPGPAALAPAPGDWRPAVRRGWGGRRLAELRRPVTETYGNRCHICALPINLALRYPHPGSLSLDHVLPRSRG